MAAMSHFDGRVLSANTGLFAVECKDGTTLQCRCATRLRNEKRSVKPGDLVSGQDNGDGTGFITGVKERLNDFIRPSVCNVDMLAVIVSATTPAPQLYNIDKQTALAAINGVKCCVVVNKCDEKRIPDRSELYGPDARDIDRIYTLAGYRVFCVSAHTGEGIDELRGYLRGRFTAFSGASGAGKSSLLNALYGSCRARVGDISERIRRGKNTTRITELFCVERGTYIADTPGFTMLDLVNFDIIPFARITDAFPDLAEYMHGCRYRDCTHTGEEGCALSAAAAEGLVSPERIGSYIKMYGELKSKKTYRQKE